MQRSWCHESLGTFCLGKKRSRCTGFIYRLQEQGGCQLSTCQPARPLCGVKRRRLNGLKKHLFVHSFGKVALPQKVLLDPQQYDNEDYFTTSSSSIFEIILILKLVTKAVCIHCRKLETGKNPKEENGSTCNSTTQMQPLLAY